ncbi:3-oxoacyl-ACP synthase III family protein [Nocardia pseudobrasiliensis]|uniref:3-oxoacyl-[acyl-carrier-protein] synthase-3 n=1 Tax=Nocardia pseudobrasiliensis TaxID=45979 RepID=A0A370IEQ1_9NOCA|nr:ketoacyl-ACP synthase III [Nocardia pseudobrasiliensis]RDI69050.1 3-oxoacyl-[acyl-carrier-protein] synthase-3 [Nocardia pseudobrasiliensis]
MPKWTLAPVTPLSLYVKTPKRRVTNAELCERLDSTPEWIEERVGIRERRFMDPEVGLAEFSAEAVDKAIALAGLTPGDIDVVISVTSTPDWFFPSFGVTVAGQAGIATTRIVDLTQTACAGAIYALYTAGCLLQEPGLENALIVVADRYSSITDPDDRRIRILFGDAAAAMVVRRCESGGVLGYDLGNQPSGGARLPTPWHLRGDSDSTELPRGPYLHLDGRDVWQAAVTLLPDSLLRALSAAGVKVEDVSGFALHQANVRMLESMTRTLGADPELVPITADTLGNTAAVASLTALHQLAQAGRAKRRDVILMGAIGAGYMWGSVCFELADDLRVGSS